MYIIVECGQNVGDCWQRSGVIKYDNEYYFYLATWYTFSTILRMIIQLFTFFSCASMYSYTVCKVCTDVCSWTNPSFFFISQGINKLSVDLHIFSFMHTSHVHMYPYNIQTCSPVQVSMNASLPSPSTPSLE